MWRGWIYRTRCRFLQLLFHVRPMQTNSPPQTFDNIDTNNLAALSVKRFRGKQLVTEYVDMSTGQVVPRKVAEFHGVRAIRPDARVRRERKLNLLRPEPRRFANFLLRFRDSHGKFLVSMEHIVKWFADLRGMRPYHVRRYSKPLIDAGILDSRDVLNEDFMIVNRKAGRETTKGDETRAYLIYLRFKATGELGRPSTS